MGGNVSALLMSDAITVNDNYIWIVSLEKMMLIKINRENGKIDHVDIIPNDKNKLIPYRFIFLYGEYIYLLPYEENRFLKYSIEEETFIYIDNDCIDVTAEDSYKLSAYVIIDNYAVVCGGASEVFIINLVTDKIETIDLNDVKSGYSNISFEVWRYIYKTDNKVVFVPLLAPYIVEIDIYTKKVDVRNMKRASSTVFDNSLIMGEMLYYFDRSNASISLEGYNLSSGTTKSVLLPEFKKRDEYRTFGYITGINNKIYCLPGINDKCYVIDVTTDKVEKIDGLPIVDSYRLGLIYPYEFNYRNGFVTEDEKIIAIHPWSENIVEIDVNTSNVLVTKVDDTTVDWDKFFISEIEQYSGKMILKEWKTGMLESYITMI